MGHLQDGERSKSKTVSPCSDFEHVVTCINNCGRETEDSTCLFVDNKTDLELLLHFIRLVQMQKSSYKYEIVMYWSGEDDAFVAEIPELPGCMAHGSTQEDALKNINEAMQLWIDTAHEHGDPVPKPRCHRLMYA